MPSCALQVQPRDLVVGAERVQLGPAIEVLERIVRPVVRAPAQEALQIAALVVVLLVELAARGHVLGEQPPLERRPRGRRHRRVDDERSGVAERAADDQGAMT